MDEDTGATAVVPTIDMTTVTIGEALQLAKHRVDAVILKHFLPMRDRLELTTHVAVGTVFIYRENMAMIYRTYNYLDTHHGDHDGVLDVHDTGAWKYLLEQDIVCSTESRLSLAEFQQRMADRALVDAYREQKSPRHGSTFEYLLAEAEYTMNRRMNVSLRQLCGILSETAAHDDDDSARAACPAAPSPVGLREDAASNGAREWGNYGDLATDVAWGSCAALDLDVDGEPWHRGRGRATRPSKLVIVSDSSLHL